MIQKPEGEDLVLKFGVVVSFLGEVDDEVVALVFGVEEFSDILQLIPVHRLKTFRREAHRYDVCKKK